MSDLLIDDNISHCVENTIEIDSDDLWLEIQSMKNHSAKKPVTQKLSQG